MATCGGDYVPPDRADVLTLGSERIGITNSLFLKFPLIHVVGDVALLDQPMIAIVGARRASIEGRRRASQLARDCARAGIVVVSGLAEGIDLAAHTAAIENGGRTVAVIGTPLDMAYPRRHASLQREIYREQLLLSPFDWGAKLVPDNFPERNRIMARLASATVIVEARDTSGSLHQARESIDVGHPVFIAENIARDARLSWPRRFLGGDKPLGRILRASTDVIDFALFTHRRGVVTEIKGASR